MSFVTTCALLLPLLTSTASPDAPLTSTLAEPTYYALAVWGYGVTTEITFVDGDGYDIGVPIFIDSYPNGARNTLNIPIPLSAVGFRWGVYGPGWGNSGYLPLYRSFKWTWNSAKSGGTGAPRGNAPRYRF
jgi:hypothetical protein